MEGKLMLFASSMSSQLTIYVEGKRLSFESYGFVVIGRD